MLSFLHVFCRYQTSSLKSWKQLCIVIILPLRKSLKQLCIFYHAVFVYFYERGVA